jgi:hypothetical protein
MWTALILNVPKIGDIVWDICTFNGITQHYILEDGTLQNYLCKNFKFHTV